MIASDRDSEIGCVAFAGCQNPYGREVWLSAELEDRDKMHLPAQQGNFPITAEMMELRVVMGRKGSCAKLQFPSSSGFGSSALLV